MRKKKLRHYLDKRWAKARSALQSCMEDGSAAALHRFRVEVKKIRAFISLEESMRHASALKKTFKPVRTLFGKAGRIRDIQLRLELGEHYHAGKEFRRQQEARLKAAVHDLHSEKAGYESRTRKSYKRLRRKIKPLTKCHIRAFYRHELDLVAGIMAGQPSATALHTCRKHIKVLLYNYKIVRKALKKPINRDYLKQLEKTLGSWHDNLLASRFFPRLKARDKSLRDNIGWLSKDFEQRALL